MVLSSKQVSGDSINWWPQSLLMKEGGGLELPKGTFQDGHQQQQQQSEPLRCPRCDSTNTKFCYYNNYNKSQPRHFCKACRRHWTKGGTLRNVPVGGGRKNKRLKTTTNSNQPLQKQQQRQQQLGSLPLPDDHHGQKLSEILYQTLINNTPPQPDYIITNTNNNDNIHQSSNSIACSTSSSGSSSGRGYVSASPTSLPPMTLFPPLTGGSVEKDPFSHLPNFVPSVSSLGDAISDDHRPAATAWPTPLAHFLDPGFWNWEDLNSFSSPDLRFTSVEDITHMS